ILRCAQLQANLPNGDLVYQVRATSRDCKFRDNESFVALQDENIAGFLDLRVRDLLDATALQQVAFEDHNRKLSNIFSAELITFDRGALSARISLSTFRGADVI